jgi:hypothetical protein
MHAIEGNDHLFQHPDMTLHTAVFATVAVSGYIYPMDSEND